MKNIRHPNLLDRQDTVLAVIDLQKPFLQGIFERERVIDESVRLIKAARILGLPVISTLQNPDRMGDMVTEVLTALPDDERIGKTCFSSCGSQEFLDRLAATGRKSVLICGVETHICISQTAHDLLAAGYKIHVALDAVSSRTEDNWIIGVDKMRQSGVIITSVEAAIYELLVDYKAPEFKQILDLVR